MTPRIILTIGQARDLQHEHGPDDISKVWPSTWNWLLDVQIPILPDKKHDDTRLQAAVRMLDMGCEEQQIAEQLNWQTVPMRMLTRLMAFRGRLAPRS